MRFLLFTTIMSLLMLTACGHAPSQPPSSHDAFLVTLNKTQETALGIKTALVDYQDLALSVDCAGQIQAADYFKAPIFPPASGRITSIPVLLGQHVSQGTVLASIKSDEVGELQSELLQQTNQNQAAYRQSLVERDLYKAAYEREQQLFNEEISSKADLEAARAQYKKAQESLKALTQETQSTIAATKDRLALYGLSSDRVNHIVRSKKIYPIMSIVSPLSGIVISRNVNTGEFVAPDKELFTVANLQTVWLVGNVSEKDVEKIHMNDPIDVQVDSYGTRTFKGMINFVSSLLDPQTRTMTVRGEIQNNDGMLKPNMFARMHIQVGQKHTLVVPQSAVHKIGDYDFVFVQKAPHAFKAQKVLLGDHNDHFIEVREGLEANDRVVIHGSLALKGLALMQVEETSGGPAH